MRGTHMVQSKCCAIVHTVLVFMFFQSSGNLTENVGFIFSPLNLVSVEKRPNLVAFLHRKKNPN